MRKLAEGGFNRVFELTMRDGHQIIARLPYPSIQPKALATASEVATMDVLRSHGIPTPKVYDYSTDATGSVGSEYILMEKLCGQCLGVIWHELADKERVKILGEIVDQEVKFFSITFPASGSIYYTADLPSYMQRTEFDEPAGRYCVGPDVSLQYWFESRSQLKIRRGSGKGTKSRDDNHKITGIIDWQHSSVLPIFLHAGVPFSLQNYGDPLSEDLIKPEFPANLDESDAEHQEKELELYRRRHTHFYYIALTASKLESHFEAMYHDKSLFRKKLYQHATAPWKGNSIPLKADLVHLSSNWHEFANVRSAEDNDVSECPITFDESDIEDTITKIGEQEDMNGTMSILRDAIGVNCDGWTSCWRYDDAVAQATAMKEQALISAEDDHERDMIKRHWPFDDFDEGG